MEEVLEEKTAIRKIDANYITQREKLDSSRKELVKIMMVVRKHYRKIPEDVVSDVKASIGSVFDRYTKAPLRGITDEEVRILMPRILKIKETNEQFDQLVNDYFAELKIDAPYPEGTLLNITTKKNIPVQLGEEQVLYDMPESPIDYIKYKQCLADKTVAVTDQEKRNLGEFKFYLEDPRQEKKKKLNRVKEISQIQIPYNELTGIDGNGELVKKIKVKQVLTMLNRNPYFMNDEDMILELLSIKDEAIKAYDNGVPLTEIDFYNVVNDPDLAMKASIREMTSYGILDQVGESYVDGSDSKLVLGNNISQVVVFLKDPANQELKMKYKNALQEKRK